MNHKPRESPEESGKNAGLSDARAADPQKSQILDDLETEIKTRKADNFSLAEKTLKAEVRGPRKADINLPQLTRGH